MTDTKSTEETLRIEVTALCVRLQELMAREVSDAVIQEIGAELDHILSRMKILSQRPDAPKTLRDRMRDWPDRKPQ